MKMNCDFIRDLLPLYAENMARESTRKLIEEHLESCGICKAELQTMQERQVLPIRTDCRLLEDYNKKRIKRAVLTGLLAVLLLLTVAECLLICYTVSVWLTAEEAVAEVVELGGGTVNLVWAEDANIDAGFYTGRSVFASGLRWPKPNESIDGKINEHTVDSALWYIGGLAGEADTLLWGDSGATAEEIRYDNTLVYLFYITLGAGVACLAAVAIKWKGRSVLRWMGTLLLCCAVSCWFVTAGRFAIPALYDRAQEIAGRPGMLAERLIHTGVLAMLSWGTAMAAWERKKLWRPEKRREYSED